MGALFQHSKEREKSSEGGWGSGMVLTGLSSVPMNPQTDTGAAAARTPPQRQQGVGGRKYHHSVPSISELFLSDILAFVCLSNYSIKFPT